MTEPFAEPAGATPLDPDEREGLKLDSIRSRADLDRVEQANIIDGLQWLKRQRGPDILSDGFLRELHKQLFGQVWRWAGLGWAVSKNREEYWRRSTGNSCRAAESARGLSNPD